MREGPGEPWGLGVPHLWAFSLRPHTPLSWMQGVVIGTGEKSQFGEVFKMMQAEEVRDWGLWVSFFFRLFVYSWLHWVFIAVCRLSLAAASSSYSRGAQASHCGWCCGARALGPPLPRCMWDPPGSGIEPVSPILAGGFSTIGPAGKPWVSCKVGFEMILSS